MMVWMVMMIAKWMKRNAMQNSAAQNTRPVMLPSFASLRKKILEWAKVIDYIWCTCDNQEERRHSKTPLHTNNVATLKFVDRGVKNSEVLWWACLSVCLSSCPSLCLSARISKTTCLNFTKFSVHVTCGRPQCNTLCTSGVVDDVMFSHNGANGPESKTTRMFLLVCQVVAPGGKLLCTTAGLFAAVTRVAAVSLGRISGDFFIFSTGRVRQSTLLLIFVRCDQFIKFFDCRLSGISGDHHVSHASPHYRVICP